MAIETETGQSRNRKVPRGELYSKLGNVLVDVYLQVIGPTALSVYCVLLRRAGQDPYAYPGRKDIAYLIGQSTDTVDRALKRLTGEDGVLIKSGLRPLIRKESRRTDNGDQTSNIYHILKDISIEAPEAIPRRRKQRSDFGSKRTDLKKST
jgi:hypothetical protein